VQRLVFYVAGYERRGPESLHGRFVREIARFEKTWSVRAEVTPPEVSPDAATWRIATSGPDWQTGTVFRLFRWDDVIAKENARSNWVRVPLALRAGTSFKFSGALWGYARTSWRYAAFFVYPYLLLMIAAGLSLAFGIGLAGWSGSAFLGFAGGVVSLVLLIFLESKALLLDHLLDDWIFAYDYARHEHPVLGPRLDRMAEEICEAARTGGFDEIVVMGHSLGAVLAVDLLGKALQRQADLGSHGSRVACLTVGSSVLKIGFHGSADHFRNNAERVALAPGVFWGEYQALNDVMNFYKTNPIAAMGLRGAERVHVRIARFRRMLEPDVYRRMQRNFFRLHCQFVSGNTRRAPYDFYMLLCGPFPVADLVRSEEGAVPWIGTSGEILGDGREPSGTPRLKAAE
jgi:pimeloyl-ACP methyl ester carboxylesterase